MVSVHDEGDKTQYTVEEPRTDAAPCEFCRPDGSQSRRPPCMRSRTTTALRSQSFSSCSRSPCHALYLLERSKNDNIYKRATKSTNLLSNFLMIAFSSSGVYSMKLCTVEMLALRAERSPRLAAASLGDHVWFPELCFSLDCSS